MSAILGLATTAAMLALRPDLLRRTRVHRPGPGSRGPLLDLLFLGAVPFWLFNAAASVLAGGGNNRVHPPPRARSPAW